MRLPLRAPASSLDDNVNGGGDDDVNDHVDYDVDDDDDEGDDDDNGDDDDGDGDDDDEFRSATVLPALRVLRAVTRLTVYRARSSNYTIARK